MLQCIANPKFPTPKSEQWTCKSDGLCRRPAATISEPSSAGACVGKQEQEAGGCWKTEASQPQPAIFPWLGLLIADRP